MAELPLFSYARKRGESVLWSRLTLVIAIAAVCLAIVPSESPTASAVISTGELAKFKIESLTVSTTNRVGIDMNPWVSDDRGGMALSSTKVFLMGDGGVGYANKSDLSSPGSGGFQSAHDALVSDLKTMTAYVFDYGNGTTNFTKLTQIDQSTGAIPGSPTVITLSSSIPWNGGEIYSGYGRVVYRNSNGTVYDIDMPSGTVYNRGTVTVNRAWTESWVSWGVAEFFDGELWLAVSYNGNIVRYKVSDGTMQTIVSTASGLGDMASFIVDPVSQRWYFHYESYASAFSLNLAESLVYAPAVISTTPNITLTPSSLITNANSFSVDVSFGEAVTGVTASDFSLGGSATGWSISSLVANSSTSYTLNLTQVGSASGTLNVTLASASVNWTAGATNIPDTAVTSSNVTVDHDPPTASYSSQPSSPAAAMSLSFGVTFNESVSGISAADFSNAGTALGCVFTPSATSGSSVNVVVTQCQEGTLQLVLASNGVSDAATNTGPASQLSSNVITLQASALSVTAANKSINYGGSWTDSYSATGLIGSDTITVTYTYSGTTTSGATYGPSATKPTVGGSYTIIPSVSYGGSNANRYALTKANGTLTIARVAQSTLSVTSTSGTYGAGLTLTSSGGSGTGSVSYAVSSGTCFVLGSLLTLGDAGSSCNVIATKAADDNYLEASSLTTSITTNRANQATLSVTSSSATFGQTMTLTSSGGTGTGAVTYAVTSGTCSVSGSTLTPGDAGSLCTVTATKALDTNYNAVSSSAATISIARAVQSALSVTSLSATYGQTMTLTSSGGSGTGSVAYSVVSGTCTISGTSLTPGEAGSLCVVKATKAQSTNYLANDSADASVTIARAAQAPLSVTSTTATYGQTLSLTTSGGSGTGSVSYAVSSGSCFVIGSLLTVGDAGSSCAVVATKALDTNYLEVSSSSTTVTINKAAQSSISVSSTTATYGQTLSLTTSGGSGTGSVSYTVVSGTCTISGSSLTPGNAASSCVVKATKATDTNFNERSSANTTITVAKASQSGLNLTSANSFTVGGVLSLAASGGQSSGSLSWSLQSGTCTLTGTILSSSRGGISCVVEVVRAGDSNYLSSTVTETITVNKIPQLLTFRSTPASSTLVGSTYTVVVDSDASLTPNVAIANSSASVCSISAGVVSFNAVGSCVVSASQSGTDMYASAAASQSITVTAVPVTTVAAPAAAAPSSATTVPVATTLPQKAVAAAVSSTSSTSTTTTTTTTIPQSPEGPIVGADGQPVEVKAGEATAMVEGKAVKVNVVTEKGQIVMRVGEDIQLRLGSTNPSSNSALVNSDGVLTAFGDQTIDVNMQGLVPATTYTVYMFSQPIELGRGVADTKGNIIKTVVVPKDVETGGHTLQVNGVGKSGEVVSVSVGMKVLKKESNAVPAIIAITLAMLLALLGGRPIFRRRRHLGNLS